LFQLFNIPYHDPCAVSVSLYIRLEFSGISRDFAVFFLVFVYFSTG